MSVNLGTISGTVVAGSGVTLLARVLGSAGRPVTRASLASVAYAVSDLTAGLQTGSGALDVASSVFDALQTGDPRWTRDTPTFAGPDGFSGYNFAATLPAALFPQTSVAGNPLQQTPHRFQVDLTFTPALGEVFRVVFGFTPVRTWS